MHPKDLSTFGLDASESAAYLAMLELGPASVLHIAKKAKVNRSMLYDILDTLVAKGLAYKTVRGKKVRFAAREPETLKELLEQKIDVFEKLLPGLQAIAAKGDFKPTMSLYEGLDGIKQAYLGAAHAKEQKLYAFVGVESLLSKTQELEEFWDGQFKRERRTRNVFGQLLVPNNAAGRAFKAKDNQNFRESRLVDAHRYNFPAEVLMYDDTVVFISYTRYEEFAMTVQSPAIAETLKMVWRGMWEGAKG